MRKKKRFLSVLCALICILGFSVPSFAATNVMPAQQWEWLQEEQPSTGRPIFSLVEGTEGDYLFSPNLNFPSGAPVWADEFFTVFEKIKSDMQDDSRLVAVRISPMSNSTGSITLSFISYDLASLKPVAQSIVNGHHCGFTSDDSYSVVFSRSSVANGLLPNMVPKTLPFYYATVNTKYPGQNFVYFSRDVTPHCNGHYTIPYINRIVFDTPVKNHTLTVQYQYSDGTQAAAPVTQTVATGAAYEIVSPVLEGYTANKPTVSGIMPDNDLTVTVTYTPVPPTVTNYTLTVKYLYENGTQAAESVVQSIAAGTAYNIPSPTISNYDASQKMVSGTMPEQDLTIVVTYRKKEESSSSSSSGYPDFAPDVDWHNPFEWFDVAPNVEWHDPFAWFDIAPNVEWHNPFSWE